MRHRRADWARSLGPRRAGAKSLDVTRKNKAHAVSNTKKHGYGGVTARPHCFPASQTDAHQCQIPRASTTPHAVFPTKQPGRLTKKLLLRGHHRSLNYIERRNQEPFTSLSPQQDIFQCRHKSRSPLERRGVYDNNRHGRDF